MSSPAAEAGAAGAAALRELVLSVVVVAASDGAATACATSTTSYVSLSPPVLAVALRPGSRTAQMVLRTQQFSVSVLAADQAELARRAGRPGTATNKMAEAGITPQPPPDATGPPGVAGSGAVLWCAVTDAVPVGDSLVIFGQVTSHQAVGDDPLLIRHRRRYLATGPPVAPDLPEGYPI
jgi:flavin reductase (DIM6/NTAB) family NADH-FMN oxidoreductase RutF